MGLKEADLAPYLREVEARLLEETDYELELQRSLELSLACAHLPGIGFPKYYPELSCRRILTMDWIDGLTLDKFADQETDQELKDAVGQSLWDFYHYQIHQLRLFHADPHPGNFKVHERTLFVLDFGCTKKLDEEFYRKNFRLLDPRLIDDRPALEKALDDLGVLLDTDTRAQREQFLSICIPSIELLARPFRTAEFNFGDPAFMQAVYLMGETNSQNDFLRNLRGARGSAHSIYVNRAYFGLYSLLARLRARIRATLPDWVQS
jgi:predicted unusual protein kinase regulating ubiquinone biosynthesis (AarF/ABC1/UbiB family)